MTPTLEHRAQHWQALDLANTIRLYRASVKRSIGVGNLAVADILRNPDDRLSTMPVASLFKSMNRWGTTRVRKFLAQFAISENREVGKLSERQRLMLADAIERKVAA